MSWSYLKAIVEKESCDEAEGDGKNKKEECQGGFPLVPEHEFFSEWTRDSRTTVYLEMGAWRVRGGVIVEEAGGNSKSFFDDFPCCLARPIREGANLEEIVNGASSFAAPMFEKFRE